MPATHDGFTVAERNDPLLRALGVTPIRLGYQAPGPVQVR